ncbi:AAA family ATPase [Chromatium okenii]|uniref:ATP-binding protein n=1 Tax=Chromatium okenii TaxID=61644 RepID=UPI001908D87B|nr:ATP-binding protein [Chromatium okenii]MBK1642880.1 AAA family ATPase [Chromatium okenii]
MYRKAERKQAKLRLALCGPSGSGKTYSALLIAQGMQPNKVALIDTERGSAELYADLIPYDVAPLQPPYTPQRYIDLIHGAEKAGYDVLIIDSLSHAWTGIGGVLEMHDKAAAATRNSFTAWREVTPKHNALVDAIIGADLHVIVTMRTKTAYDMVDDNGKKKPVKIGLAPVQREGVEYEFTTVIDLAVEQHVATAAKDRTRLFDGQHFVPTVATGAALREWLLTGTDPTEESHKTLAAFKTAVNEMESTNHLNNWWRKHSTEIAMLTAPDRDAITAHCAQHKAALTAAIEAPVAESEPPKPNGIDHAEAVTH